MNESAGASGDTGARDYNPVYSWYVVCLLAFLTLFSWLDRQIIVLLIDPIRADLGISEVQVSLLTGFAFAFLYALCGLPFGWAADRLSRRHIIAAGVFVWSIATICCGLARSFWSLFAARVGVGFGEAALSPSASSILSDIFPPHRLAFANSVLGMGAALGGGISFIIAGLIAGLVAHGEQVVLPLIGEVRGWQVAFIVVGLPGPFLALLAFTIREPKRTGKAKKVIAADGSESQARFLSHLRENWKFYSLHISGFSLLAMGSYATQVWGPSYLTRVFGWGAAQVGTTFGGALSISMISSLVVAGLVIDHFYGKGMRDAHLRLFAYASLACTPIILGAIIAGDPWIFIIGFFIYKTMVGAQGPIAVACLQIVAPNEFRGRLVAMLLFAVMFGGLGLGPFFVAMLTQYFFADDKMVGWSLATALLIIYPLASLILWLGTKYQRQMGGDPSAPAPRLRVAGGA